MSNRVRFTYDLSGGQLFRLQSGGYVGRDLLRKAGLHRELAAFFYLPEELLEKVGKDFARLDNETSKITRSNPTRQSAGDFTKDGTEFLTSQVRLFPRAYWAYYRALLHAMDELLRNPQVPVKAKSFRRNRRKKGEDFGSIASVKKNAPFNRVVPLHINELPGAGFSKNIRLRGDWPGLTDFTLEKKEELGYAPTFWKHTTEASQAFHALVTSRLAHIKPSHFIVGNKPQVSLIGGSLGSGGPRKRVAVARYKFTIGVPSWNDKMDALISAPFASGSITSTQTAANAYFRTRTGQPRALHGVDRIMVAEAYRPWLRNLSKQAGQALLAYLRGGAAPTAASSEFASGIHERKSAEEKAARARKWKDTQDGWEKGRVAKAKAKEDRAAKAAATAAQRAADKARRRAAEGSDVAKASAEKIAKINAKVRQQRQAKPDRSVDAIKQAVDKVQGKPRRATARSPDTAKNTAPKPARQTASTRAGRKAALQKTIQELESRSYQTIFNELHEKMVSPGHKLTLDEIDRLRAIAVERYQTQVVKPLEEARNRLKKFK